MDTPITGKASVPYVTVDAFTAEPFRGNPAAICFLTQPVTESWMQQVAAEMNLAETAFVRFPPDRDGCLGLRWFTPRTEVDLCGHATLAAAHALWESNRSDPRKPIHFQTRSGILKCERDGDQMTLDFPETPPEPATPPDDLCEALGINAWEYFGKSPFDYLVVIADAANVRNLKPNLLRLERYPVRGIIVTARSDRAEFDIVSRFFAPAAGVNEDPVTGSAHCCLMPYWGERLGKETLRAYQASERGGSLALSWVSPRVMLSGKAVTVLRGEVVV